MFKKKWVFRILVSFVLSLSLMACVVATPSEEVISDSKKQGLSETNYDKEKEIKTVEKSTLSEGNISDNNLLYSQDDDYDVTTMYLTVSFGNEADGSNHTWKEINTYSAYDYKDMGVDRYKVEGILQIDEIGNGLTKESYGYNENVPNVSVQIRPLLLL